MDSERATENVEERKPKNQRRLVVDSMHARKPLELVEDSSNAARRVRTDQSSSHIGMDV